jgi:hypothetical protein
MMANAFARNRGRLQHAQALFGRKTLLCRLRRYQAEGDAEHENDTGENSDRPRDQLRIQHRVLQPVGGRLSPILSLMR